MNISESSPDLPELEALAEFLYDKQDAILAEWQKRVLNTENKQGSILASLSQKKFYNNIPEFLEQLRNSLRGEETPLSEIARLHGAHRWEHGLDLRKVTIEWSQLHFVIVNQVYDSQKFISISPTALAEAQKLLTWFIHEGIRASIHEYYRLLRVEAEGKMRVLETIVREKDELTEKRSQNLQEASHDMKGSMTAIRINLYLLENADLSDKARVRQLLQKLSGATDSLNELLITLLDLSRLEAGREELQISEFDAAGMLRSLSDTMGSLAEAENLDLRVRGNDQMIVRGDRLKIHRIAQNLLLNALKYTQEGYVELSWGLTSSDKWQLTVRDTGPGMDLSHFRRTSTPEPSGESMVEIEEEHPGHIPQKSEGIGLFIVRRLCELLDGVIDIESEADVGTTIRVTFPKDY